MRGFQLGPVWTDEHTRCFLRLKRILTSEPVLRSPRFETVDKHPFIVTTDGCQGGFAGTLTQEMETVLPKGKVVVREHPIAYASKRTSSAEKRYLPHLLEFAALKFSLNKFANVVRGQPVLVKTDCRALRDVLANDRLNVAHDRWRNGILGYNIVAAKHIKGRNNVAADVLSQKYEDVEEEDGDGHEWSVSPDWEASSGLLNNVFHVSAEEVGELESRDVLLVVALPEGTMALRERLKDEPVYVEVLDALTELDVGVTMHARKRALHKTSEYFVEDGKLWHLGGGAKGRARSQRECVTRAEAVERAAKVHTERGHFGRDAIKMILMDEISSPRLDASILEAIRDCGQCKVFGAKHIHARLDPITRHHPFELMVADYLSMPVGKGGFKTGLVMLDTMGQKSWGEKLKTAGTGKTTVKMLYRIGQDVVDPEVLMVDGGSHFNCQEVRDFCESRGIKLMVIAKYAPWVNGLVEGTNKILLHILARLCAPDVGEDEWDAMTWEMLPKNWPEHWDEAFRILNKRILPSMGYTPDEISLGRVVNTLETPVSVSVEAPTAADVEVHMVYVAQQSVDGYAERVKYALGRKATFDRKLIASRASEVKFERGQLVQVANSVWDYTFKSLRKLIYYWSTPHRVSERVGNSYRLETLQGVPLNGLHNSRRLRAFVPKKAGKLEAAQAAFKATLAPVVEEDEEAERVAVELERAEAVGASLE